MRSMTGFGSGSGNDGKLAVTIEMRAVNQRFLELNIRMPHAYLALEDRLRSGIKAVLKRGKVDVFVTVQDLDPAAPDVRVDDAALGAVKTALQDVNDRFFAGKAVTLGDVTSLTKDWFVQTPPAIDAEASWPPFEAALQGALDSMVAMREREGARLREDMLAKAENIERLVSVVEERSPRTVEEYRSRLEERLREVLAERSIDEQRLITEAAIFADKTAVDEETVRLRSHIAQFRQLLEEGSPAGRKLDFLIQEFNRESNTIGSKCNDAQLAQVVVELKSEIEKIREQIQNIE